MRKLYKLAGLPKRDRALLFQAALLLAIVKLGLILFPFQTLRQWLAKISPQFTPQSPLSAEKVTWAIEVASRYIPGGVKCLTRALAARVLLARQGYITQLHIGVAKDERGQLEAHAWVESEGRVVMGRLHDGERFIPLANFKH